MQRVEDKMSEQPKKTHNWTAVYDAAKNNGASDIHIQTDEPPIIRAKSRLLRLDTAPVAGEELDGFLKGILSEGQYNRWYSHHDVEASFSYHRDGLDYQFRVHVGKDRRGPNVAMRILPPVTRGVEDIGFPYEVWKKIINLERGLVLVTGITGSGKSTTLAALIQQMNKQQEMHIITLEDPIEYVFKPVKSIIQQREVGKDVASFDSGLRSALRQDPDVIMVGEIRDLETATEAIEATETGHLVLATLHTKSAAATVQRIEELYDTNKDKIRGALASNLAYILCQQLVPYHRGQRTLVMEVLRVDGRSNIQNLIRQGKYEQIDNYMQPSPETCTIRMDDRFVQLVKDGLDPLIAVRFAFNPDAMQKTLVARGYLKPTG